MDFRSKIGLNKISINGGARIKMDLFLSFLTVEASRPTGVWAGKNMGWTKLVGENGLNIRGGIFQGVEYLDSLEYGKNLHNKYNNYVNPFYLFDIMTDGGKLFFVDFYRDDISKIISYERRKIDNALEAIMESKERINYWKNLTLLK